MHIYLSVVIVISICICELLIYMFLCCLLHIIYIFNKGHNYEGSDNMAMKAKKRSSGHNYDR